MAGIGTDAIPDLMRRNLLEVFGGRDPVARRAAIEELYDPAVRFVDPEGEGVGHDAIDAAAQAVIDRFPDFHFAPPRRRRRSATSAASPGRCAPPTTSSRSAVWTSR